MSAKAATPTVPRSVMPDGVRSVRTPTRAVPSARVVTSARSVDPAAPALVSFATGWGVPAGPGAVQKPRSWVPDGVRSVRTTSIGALSTRAPPGR